MTNCRNQLILVEKKIQPLPRAHPRKNKNNGRKKRHPKDTQRSSALVEAVAGNKKKKSWKGNLLWSPGKGQLRRKEDHFRRATNRLCLLRRRLFRRPAALEIFGFNASDANSGPMRAAQMGPDDFQCHICQLDWDSVFVFVSSVNAAESKFCCISGCSSHAIWFVCGQTTL